MALVQTREVARFGRSCRRDGGVISFRQPGPIARSPATLPRCRRAYLHPPRSADRASESLPSAFRTPQCNAVPTSEGSCEPCRCPVHQPGHPVSKTQLKAQILTNTQDHAWLKCGPLNRSSIGTNRGICPSPPNSSSVCTRALFFTLYSTTGSLAMRGAVNRSFSSAGSFLGWPADGISDRSWAKCGSCRHSLSPRARRNLRYPQVRNATCSGISFAADRR